MTTITEEDMKIAHRLSNRYNRNKRFGHDDAFQAAMEGLLQAGVPDNEGLRVLAMRNGISRQVTKAVFPVSIPRASYDRMKKAGTLPDYSKDVDTSELVFEVPEADQGFERVEDFTLVQEVLQRLDPADLRVVKTFMNGKRFAYKTREADQARLEAVLDRIRKEMT